MQKMLYSAARGNAGITEMADAALVTRLRNFAPLSADDVSTLRELESGGMRSVSARQDLVREGELARSIFIIASGWACRYKALEDGRRQSLAFLVPGDLCDFSCAHPYRMDHSIGALTPLTCYEVPHERFERLIEGQTQLAQALWRQTLADGAAQREWTLNVGQRNGLERIAHLFCEIFMRLDAVGLAEGKSCPMPITQVDIAEATGLTSVHVNRVLQEMRAAGLIVLRGRKLEVPDMAKLHRAGLFQPGYLHLKREGTSTARASADRGSWNDAR